MGKGEGEGGENWFLESLGVERVMDMRREGGFIYFFLFALCDLPENRFDDLGRISKYRGRCGFPPTGLKKKIKT